jgi:hypothetical protein
LRRKRQLTVGSAEHPEESAHLVERLCAGALDRVERAKRLVRLRREHLPSSPCLQDDDGDRMRDDVMQLTRDAGALLCDRGLRRLLLLFETTLVEAPATDNTSGRPRCPQREAEEDDRRDVGRLRVADEGDEEQHDRQGSGGENSPAAGVCGAAIDGQQHEQSDRLDIAQSLGQEHADRSERRQREQQGLGETHAHGRAGAEHDEHRRGRERLTRREVERDDLDQGHRGDGARERDVAVPADEHFDLRAHPPHATRLLHACHRP